MSGAAEDLDRGARPSTADRRPPGGPCMRRRATSRPRPAAADDLPLHPAIVRWAAAYARAADGERDEMVALMLAELNALLRDGSMASGGERGAPGPDRAT